MKVMVAQINPIVGDLAGNLFLIQQNILQAVSSECSVVVFPELATTGYPPRDLLYSSAFWESHEKVIDKLHDFVRKQSRQITVIVGGLHEEMLSGGRYARYNAAWILDQHFGRRVVHKRLLPCYDVFDETRYFSSGADEPYAPIPIHLVRKLGTKEIGCDILCDVLICEDIWNNEYRGGEEWMKPATYTTDPLEAIARHGKGPLFVLNGSPFWIGRIEEVQELVESICKRLQQPVVWCNQVGSHDDIITGGYSMVSFPGNLSNNFGQVIDTRRAKAFQEDSMIVRLSDEQTSHSNLNEGRDIKAPLIDPPMLAAMEVDASDFEMWTIYKALFLHMADYKRRCGFQKAVLGLSGGIDSAVVAVVAAHVFGSENVTGIAMPSPYSSDGSVSDAEKLAHNLHIGFQIKKITESYGSIKRLFLSGGKQQFDHPVTDENIQPRVRGVILMAHSNEHDPCLLLTTGNKSEITVGYCVDGDSILFTDDGMKTARGLANDLGQGRIVSSIDQNRFMKAHVSSKKNLVEITSKIGTTFTCSGDHEIKIFDRVTGEISFKKAEDLSQNDLLIMRIGDNIWGNKTELREFHFQRADWDYRSHEFKPPRKLSSMVAKFIGVCVADGSYVGKGLYRIRSSKADVASFATRFLSSLSLPESCWKITEPESDGCFFVEVSSVQFCAWLRHIGVKHGSHAKIVPDCIAQSSAEMVKGFLSGVMLDSTTDSKSNLSEITYHSVSSRLAKTVHLMLLNLGVLNYYREYRRSKGDLYEAYIPAQETEKLLAEGFSFLKPSIRQRILDNVSYARQKYKSFVDGIWGCGEQLDVLVELLSWEDRRIIENIRKSESVGRKTLKKYISKLTPEQQMNPGILTLLEATDSNVYFVPISQIQTMIEIREMFDFSMRDLPEFIINGAVVHNCTIYGDMCGGLAVISDLWKTEVYSLAKFMNKYFEEPIPEDTITKPASAELRPDQQDTDSLPPYKILDPLLRLFVEEEMSPERVFQTSWFQAPARPLDSKTVMEMYCKYRIAEYKRQQMPIGPKLSRRAFSSGRRMPIAMKLTTV